MSKFHDRLDLKLRSDAYTAPFCGSLNLDTGKAEYCEYSCQRLRERLASGDDPDAPLDITGWDNYEYRTSGGPITKTAEKDLRA